MKLDAPLALLGPKLHNLELRFLDSFHNLIILVHFYFPLAFNIWHFWLRNCVLITNFNNVYVTTQFQLKPSRLSKQIESIHAWKWWIKMRLLNCETCWNCLLPLLSHAPQNISIKLASNDNKKNNIEECSRMYHKMKNTIEKMLKKLTKNAKNEQIKSACNLDNVLQHCSHRHGTFHHCLLTFRTSGFEHRPVRYLVTLGQIWRYGTMARPAPHMNAALRTNFR